MNRRRNTPAAEPVTPQRFIEVWQSSSSLNEVAQRTRCRKSTVRIRGYRYQQRGIPLKALYNVTPDPPDWKALAKYAAELLAPPSPPPSNQGGRQPLPTRQDGIFIASASA